MIKIKAPFDIEELKKLRVGDMVEITGIIYTARDAAHARIVKDLEKGELKFPIENSCIYYVGPTPSKPGEVIGSCGPTSSYRMDSFTPTLLKAGSLGMIGKGKRSDEVIQKIKEHGAVYFTAIGGAAALLKNRVKSAKVIDYEDLGPEALRELEVENFPATVTIDSLGNNLYEIGKEEFLKLYESN